MAVDPGPPASFATSREVGGRRGIVLAAVLLLLVALTLVAHGALYLARQELLVARISVRDVQARIAAESGVRRIQRSWPPDLDSLLVGAVRDLGGTVGPRASYRGRVRRLGEELFWVWARGEVTGWPGAREVARVLWRPDPASRLAGLAAAVETGAPGAVAPGASVSGAAVTAPPPGWDGICLPLDPRLAALYPLGSVPDLGVLPGGAGGGVAALGLGPVEAEGLLAAADLVVAGAPVPRPSAAGGVCVTSDSLNWGAPSDPSSPCAAWTPLVVAPGSLSVPGGEGQGILVVLGDLRLDGSALFHGVVLSTGDLVLAGDAQVRGFVRALGGARLLDQAVVSASGCPALRALQGAPGLGRALPLAGGSWLDLH